LVMAGYRIHIIFIRTVKVTLHSTISEISLLMI
jgi:hypothetical protein